MKLCTSTREGPRRRGPKPKTEITPRQLRTLQEIDRFSRRNGLAPTIQELAGRLGISAASAHEQVTQLVRKGYVRRAEGKTRGLVVVRLPVAQPARLIAIPLVGSVAAGSPVVCDENTVGEVLVEEELAGQSSFALSVHGMSMVGAGIRDGDIVLVRQQPLAECGDVVVALVDGEATVKRLYLRESIIELQPDAPGRDYWPIPIGPESDLRIVGKVVAIRATHSVPMNC